MFEVIHLKKYRIMIYILLILGLIFWIDVHKIRTYSKTISNKDNVIKITLTSDYIKANRIFKSSKKNDNISSIQKYMRQNQIPDYVINTSKMMISKGSHKVGLEDPFERGNIYQILKFNNKALCMDFSLIDKNVFITVISKDYKNSKKVLQELRKKTVDEGKAFIKNKEVTVLWYQKSSLEKKDYLNIIL